MMCSILILTQCCVSDNDVFHSDSNAVLCVSDNDVFHSDCNAVLCVSDNDVFAVRHL